MNTSSNGSSGAACVFFDIGGTLGDVNLSGTAAKLVPYPDTAPSLKRLHGIVRLGVISNVLPNMKQSDVLAMLSTAGIAGYFDPQAVITSVDAGSEKPNAAIFRFAASKVGLPIGDCLFVGEDLVEVIGARVAGMQSQLKPLT
jgi:HAD superfamily hydrolase (TIGR01493 family)